MPKVAPSIGRIAAMVIFALTCFGLLLFLWLSFGGPVPLQAQGYRFSVRFPEATTLAQEADVRLAGVTVGKVKQKELDKGGNATKVEIELDQKYAPIARDTRAILRQKTLLGETFVELTPGTKNAPRLADGGELARSQVEDTTELDEIFQAFDKETRRDFQQWSQVTGRTFEKAGQDLNDSLGNFANFAHDGADVLAVLDQQEAAVKRLFRNTGVVFKALNEREGALHDLVVNSNNLFEATASRDDALAETFRIFPTFLDESKATLARLETFSRNTRPLVNDLKPVADDLGPTVRDVGALAPDLESLFRDLDPLIKESKTGLPAAARFLTGAAPAFEGLHTFLPELNPIISYANYHQMTIAGFISQGAAALAGGGPEQGQEHYFPQMGIINDVSLAIRQSRPPFERANAYYAPNALERLRPLGTIESFDCSNNKGSPGANRQTGEQRDPNAQNDYPPCVLAPPQLWGNQLFPRIDKDKSPNVPSPRGFQGTNPPQLP
jgi:phospholipid/cholesterol/gamma-HCH transport system substrate-binding protein